MAAGWWGHATPADLIWRNAAEQPDGTAYVTWSRSPDPDSPGSIDRTSWSGYDRLSDRVAAALLAAGLERGDRAAVILPDGAAVHAAFTGADKAGVVVMGIGHRAGPAEIAHLVEKSGARAVVTGAELRGQLAADAVADLRRDLPDLTHHITIEGPGQDAVIALDGEDAPKPESVSGFAEAVEQRRLGASELCLLNSTSGTTGLPKCVMQTHNRWFYFHQKAVEYSGLGSDEVFCVPVPAPFGFGLWTAHYTPTILGVPTVVMADFDTAALIRLIEAEQVTVLCAVTTQFIMMLNSPVFDDHDLSSLRLMFTGGEAIPYQRASEFEERTGWHGAELLRLQRDRDAERQPGWAIPGRPGCAPGAGASQRWTVPSTTPTTVPCFPSCEAEGSLPVEGRPPRLGYYDDAKANTELMTDDGRMLMGDIVEIDNDGYLRVVGAHLGLHHPRGQEHQRSLRWKTR